MQTAHPLIDHPSSRIIVPILVKRSESETMRAHTRPPSDERDHQEMQAVADRDRGRSARVSAGQAERLLYLRKEMMLMTMQTRAIQQCGGQMLQATDVTLDTQRDLLHLCARMEGVLWQLEDVIQVTERLMSRPLHCHYVPEADSNDDLAPAATETERSGSMGLTIPPKNVHWPPRRWNSSRRLLPKSNGVPSVPIHDPSA